MAERPEIGAHAVGQGFPHRAACQSRSALCQCSNGMVRRISSPEPDARSLSGSKAACAAVGFRGGIKVFPKMVLIILISDIPKTGPRTMRSERSERWAHRRKAPRAEGALFIQKE